MRIGIYDPYLDTLAGGEKYMLTLAACLSQRHLVDIFWDDPTILSKAEKRFQLDTAKITVVANVFSSNTSLWTRLFTTKKYDYIIFLSDGSIPLVLAKKLILHFQFPTELIQIKGLLPTIKLARVYKIICNSFYTKKYIDKTFQVDSVVVYPPATLHDKRSSTKKNMILTIGRLDVNKEGQYFKKQDIMINAFKQMVDRGFKGWEFVMVMASHKDDSQHMIKLKELAKNYPIQLVVNASHKHLQQLYEEAKIYWHAAGYNEDLEKYPERAEHFGIATVEAMNYGQIPIVINAGGQKEIVDDGKNGFLWNSLEELIAKTKMLANNHTLQEKIAIEAKKKAQMFSRDAFCKQITQIIS